MAHYDEVEGIKWKRFDQLNELIRGFRRGELTIFSGRTGSGKTTFMSEYSLDLCMQVHPTNILKDSIKTFEPSQYFRVLPLCGAVLKFQIHVLPRCN